MIMGGINDMGNYKRVMGSNGLRGFRLYTKKLSIQRFRIRFMNWFRALDRWKKCYERTVRSLRLGLTSYRKSSGNKLRSDNGSCQDSRLIRGGGERKSSECRFKSLARTNSFYTEAIADCLEFIKRNSLDHQDDDDHHHDEADPIGTAAFIR